jgi:hypothetical protein
MTATPSRTPKRSGGASEERKPQSQAVDTPKARVIRDPAFAKRLETACDAHPHSPEKHRGRLAWLKGEMAKHGVQISYETGRKWFAGEARARPGKMEVLAQVLQVDPAWLSMGIDPELQPHERKVRNAMADSAVNLIAGFVQMDGGYPAFPDENDRRGHDDHVDLYAIIRGANYSFHVSLGQKTDDKELRFLVPTRHENVTVLGVIRDTSFRIQVYELSADAISQYGHNRGGAVEVIAEPNALRKIDNFRERL